MNIPEILRHSGETPFYYYDLELLRRTLDEVNRCIEGRNAEVHYALKANSDPHILGMIAAAGFGADCVSGGEVRLALAAGFPASKISYAGVGKTDREIRDSILSGIGCFNVESIEELEVIAEIASQLDKPAPVALRVNPNIDAHTHEYITTGLEENKFGIDLRLLDRAVSFAHNSKWLNLVGLHFHIGSQVTITEPFKLLCERINGLVQKYRDQGIEFKSINVGGGLGIDYDDPDGHPIPDFKSYFASIFNNLELRPDQTMICEPGRSIVAQCGSLIATAIYVKQGIGRKFIILDAGMNDLIRPALYGAHHLIENISAPADSKTEVYDVVGPVCETSDTFARDEKLPATRRGDIFAIRSAGAYGASMASNYNSRHLPSAIYSD